MFETQRDLPYSEDMRSLPAPPLSSELRDLAEALPPPLEACADANVPSGSGPYSFVDLKITVAPPAIIDPAHIETDVPLSGLPDTAVMAKAILANLAIAQASQNPELEAKITDKIYEDENSPIGYRYVVTQLHTVLLRVEAQLAHAQELLVVAEDQEGKRFIYPPEIFIPLAQKVITELKALYVFYLSKLQQHPLGKKFDGFSMVMKHTLKAATKSFREIVGNEDVVDVIDADKNKAWEMSTPDQMHDFLTLSRHGFRAGKIELAKALGIEVNSADVIPQFSSLELQVSELRRQLQDLKQGIQGSIENIKTLTIEDFNGNDGLLDDGLRDIALTLARFQASQNEALKHKQYEMALYGANFDTLRKFQGTLKVLRDALSNTSENQQENEHLLDAFKLLLTEFEGTITMMIDQITKEGLLIPYDGTLATEVSSVISEFLNERKSAPDAGSEMSSVERANLLFAEQALRELGLEAAIPTLQLGVQAAVLQMLDVRDHGTQLTMRDELAFLNTKMKILARRHVASQPPQQPQPRPDQTPQE